MPPSLRVAVTGAAGQIAYNLLFRLISGEVFGPSLRIRLQLLELAQAMPALDGVALELIDAASPLLEAIDTTSDPARCFRGADEVILIGARPRTKGMERADLLRVNGPIFKEQGRVIAHEAASDVRILVVGNPANTNCLVACENGREVPPERWSAMTRLDMNRARALLAQKAGVNVAEVTHVAVWGNHSAAQFPDYTNARIGGKPATAAITDETWFRETFLPRVRNRGAEVIAARGHSSAASAAQAIVDHVRDRRNGTRWVSMAVRSTGAYGVPPGLIFSYPVDCPGGGDWTVIEGIPLNPFARRELDRNVEELAAERAEVKELFP
jgi:malate dehydrogenase